MNPFFNVGRAKVEARGIHSENFETMINEDTQKIIGIVTPRYELVHNNEIANLFDDAINILNPDDVTTKDYLNLNTTIWKRRMILDSDKFSLEITPGDKLGVMIEIWNSYNGKTSFGYEIMGFRWICSNGMIMGKRRLFRESFKHIISSPEMLANSIETRFKSFVINADIWKKWVNDSFDFESFKAFLDDKEYVKDRLKEALLVYWYETKQRENFKNATKWLAFNTITWAVTHAAGGRKGQAGIFSHKTNILNRLAEDFYELK